MLVLLISKDLRKLYSTCHCFLCCCCYPEKTF